MISTKSAHQAMPNARNGRYLSAEALWALPASDWDAFTAAFDAIEMYDLPWAEHTGCQSCGERVYTWSHIACATAYTYTAAHTDHEAWAQRRVQELDGGTKMSASHVCGPFCGSATAGCQVVPGETCQAWGHLVLEPLRVNQSRTPCHVGHGHHGHHGHTPHADHAPSYTLIPCSQYNAEKECPHEPPCIRVPLEARPASQRLLRGVLGMQRRMLKQLQRLNHQADRMAANLGLRGEDSSEDSSEDST